MNNTNQTPIVIAIVGLVLITLGVLFFRTDTVKETVSTDRTVETVAPGSVNSEPVAPNIDNNIQESNGSDVLEEEE